jgi:hypothetical protein
MRGEKTFHTSNHPDLGKLVHKRLLEFRFFEKTEVFRFKLVPGAFEENRFEPIAAFKMREDLFDVLLAFRLTVGFFDVNNQSRNLRLEA